MRSVISYSQFDDISTLLLIKLMLCLGGKVLYLPMDP